MWVGLFCQATLAQPIPGENRFASVSLEDGLSQVGVLDMIQDERGFMWFGTRDGLNRFDGEQFRVYRNRLADSTSLPNNTVWSLAMSTEGDLWAGTDYGLAKYSVQFDCFHQFIPHPTKPYHPQNRILTLVSLPGDRLIVGTNDGAILFNVRDNKFQDFLFGETRGMSVKSALLSEDGTLYLGTLDGLFVYDANYAFLHHYRASEASLRNDDVTSLLQDHQERIWVGTKGGLHQYQRDGEQFTFYPLGVDELTELSVEDMLEDESGTVWIAGHRVYTFKNGVFEAIYVHDPQDQFSINGDFVTSLFQSQDQVLWFGSDGYGINLLNPNGYAFDQLSQSVGNPFSIGSKFVSAVQTTPEGLVLVGTGASLDVISLEERRTLQSITTLPKLPIPVIGVTSLLPDREDKYWVGTTNGLYHYDISDNAYTAPMGLDWQHRVNCMLKFSDGELLVGSEGQGLFRMSVADGTMDPFPGTDLGDSLLGNRTVQSLTLLDEEVWMGTQRGLYVIDLNTLEITSYFHDPKDPYSLPSDQVKCVYQDTRGWIWIGTWGGGLARIDPEDRSRMKTYNLENGLTNNVVYGMLEDDEGYLWMSTNGGLIRFDPEAEEFFAFQASDGLQSNEFNTGAYHKGHDGKLFFGGVGGLNWFIPDLVRPDTSTPITLITDLYFGNRQVLPVSNQSVHRHVQVLDTLVMSWREKNVKLDLAAIDFLSQRSHLFRYQLLGRDTAWQELGTQSSIYFNSLAPGRYTLKVQSANYGGPWDPMGKSLVLIVSPPLWQQSWFRVLVVLVILAACWVGFRYRLKHLRQRAFRLEATIVERTRTIQERNEEIATQNEEIEQQNEKLMVTAEKLESRNQELIELKQSLEETVDNRTEELKVANEELAEQNTQLEQFAFITAHNLKAPISQFEGLISILPPLHTFDDYTREVLNRMSTSAHELREVVQDLNLILDIKKGSGKTYSAINLPEQLDKVVKALRSEASSNEVTLELPKEVRVMILGFQPYVHSILHNLLHNAIKYAASDRKSWVKVTLSQTEHEVELTVEDNGIGIDMALAKEKIFKLYQRFNTTHPGKGFGLFLVKTQVEAMDGTILLNSQENQGTRVQVVFQRASK